MRRLGFLVMAAGALLLPSHPAQAQVIMGRVLVAGDTVGVDGANLTLVNARGQPLLRIQSDEDGNFRIPVPEPGRYEIQADRIGFTAIRSGFFGVDREILEIELRMAQTAIPVEPINVVARREIRSGTLSEYYNRMEENRAAGIGYFVTKDDIERQAAVNASSLLRGVPSMEVIPSGEFENEIWMRKGGGRCRPEIYLDGLPFRMLETTDFDALINSMDLEGIEIYNVGHMERVAGYEVNNCGAILLWRKEDWGHPFSFKRVAIALGLGAVLFALGVGF
jgi:hypothetical protein